MPTANVVLDTTQYVRVNQGLNPLLLQAHRDDVRIVLSDAQPAVGNSAFHTLGGADETLSLPGVDVNVWALAMTLTSSLTSTETLTPTVSQQIAAPFDLEVSKGNVAGHSWLFLPARTATIGLSGYTDLSYDGGLYSFAASAETLQVRSTDAQDAPTLTGAHTVLIVTLDSDYLTQSTIVTLNGTNPVTLAGTHLRVQSAIIIAPSGSARINIGDIIIENTTPVTRLTIEADWGASQSSVFTVPAGQVAYGRHIVGWAPKNEELEIRSRATLFGTDVPMVSAG